MPAPTIDRLRGVPLFAGLDDEALGRIAERVGEFEVAPGTVMVEVAQPGTGLFVVEEGEARVDLPGGGHTMLGVGDFFGELALFTDHPHTARVSAWTAVRCLAIRRDDLSAILQEQPRIALAMLPVLAERLAGTVEGG
jgi:CRP-like cAMP-binding protein